MFERKTIGVAKEATLELNIHEYSIDNKCFGYLVIYVSDSSIQISLYNSLITGNVRA